LDEAATRSRAPAFLAELFSLLGREVEWVNVTRDTAESDLKQRREIIHGGASNGFLETFEGPFSDVCCLDVLWVDQPPVRAALQGRILVLDGLEHAERNVLPMLNNLLENREMELDDGSLIVSPERFDALEADQGAMARGDTPRRRLRGPAPVSERVVAEVSAGRPRAADRCAIGAARPRPLSSSCSGRAARSSTRRCGRG
jgi:hypothetical protein